MSVFESPTTTQRAPLLIRDPDQRVLAGVAAAAGRRLGVDVVFVRVAFAVLSLAGGAGALLYLLAWAVTPEAPGGDPRPSPAPNLRRATALGMQVLGAMLLLRFFGLWLGDPLVWPLTLAAVGSSVLWARSDAPERARWTALASRHRPLQAVVSSDASLPRRMVGAVLAMAGVFALLAANVPLADLGGAVVAFGLALAGLALLLGPGIWRLVQQVGDERRERIRSEERAEIGAHLHDSVLHTLALIQRSDSLQEMATLARSQERELRAWLQGRTQRSDAETVQSALEALAARIEANHHAAVNLVVVGDAPLDEQLGAVVAAAGEAATNAARHSGADDVSIYVEIEPDTVTAYVRDEGEGFDPAAVPAERRGIAHSIRGRIRRHGGTVTIDSQPGEGTEITMAVPRRTW
ncbi:MAG TPA: PspC domain-containing protein [Egibacteraceae bacterium]|nr:PspC domain-containing protein [Egibacteraceae bacterium]